MRSLAADTPVHATCVAIDGKAVLILGKSGSGKSTLGLSIMALGGALVSDDRVILSSDDGLVAAAPAAIAGLIEARGVGLLHADPCGPTPVVLVVDLDEIEHDRLPPRRDISILGHVIPLQHYAQGIHFASAIVQFLRGGRSH